MSEIINNFNKKFEIEELKIYETKYWVWSLRPIQPTIGSGILSLKRECTSLGNLTLEEFSDLNSIIPVIENTLKLSFNYDIINYLMLMMMDRQVHYHIIPRYKSIVTFEGDQWIDNSWPEPSDLSGIELKKNKREAILNTIKDNIK